MDAHKTGTEFWEFSMNDYAVHDMRAIVDEIHQLKAMELAERKRPDSPRSYSLTAVGHSMGGAVLMMYLVWMSLNGVPHHVSKAVLLSPAGFHSDIPLVPRIFLGSIGRLRSLVQHFIPAIYFPSPVMRTLASKFAQDVKNSPGLLELSSFLVCRLFIGGAAKDLPLKWHDDRGELQLTLSDAGEALERADRERLGEDLRKLYVALTRARYATWVGLAPIAELERGAFGYLLGGGEPLAPLEWATALEDLRGECADLALVPDPAPTSARFRAEDAPDWPAQVWAVLEPLL